MNFKHLALAAAFTLAAASGAQAVQPYGGCWHPDDIKDWSPDTDPDAKFNRSRVPLAERFKEPTLMRANQYQFYEGQVCNATILFHMCSMSPSQGANNFVGYQPTYWQYMDKLVYWAGSASEGIIIPPPAGSIDAAHAQGVKVLGQIFFPPSYYGGKQEWVRQMVSKENGKYIYAIKLYEIAKYLGFDGWFINEETGGASISEWEGFFKEFYAAAEADGMKQMELQWYNASGAPQTTLLKTHINTSQFLEYGYVGDYRPYAASYNCTPAETFSKIYGGIQCVSSGLTGYNSWLNQAFPRTGHVGSVDLFCPEERAWKDNVKDLLGTSDACGEKAYAAIKKTFDNEQKVWVNIAGDPSDVSNSSWRGLSGCILERSVITELPFVSDMSVGNGKHRFIQGKKMGTQDWYHSGMQSILPTWRFWIENRGNMAVNIDWDDAFNSGSSFAFTNIGSGSHLVRLYKTQLPIKVNSKVTIAFKGNKAPDLCLSTTSSTTPDKTISASSTEEVNGWTVARYNLYSIKNQTVYMIALDLNGDDNPTFKLGRLAVTTASYAPDALAITNAEIDSRLGEDYGDVRVSWDFDWNEDFDHFNIYVTELTGERTLVGQTRDEAFYIPRINRVNNALSVNVEIVPVTKDMTEGTATTLTAAFPEPTAPKVTMKPGKSYLKVGETTTLTATGTCAPTGWEWVLPAGLQLTSGSANAQTITVKAVSTGHQSITVKATNNIGTSTTTANAIDVLADADYSKIYNVVKLKTVLDYSGSTNETEVPSKIIDGITNPNSTSSKWCNVSPENWVIFDCKGMFKMYGFKIYDCKAGPENDENIRDYTIELSNDLETWTTVVEEYDQQDVNIKADYIVPTVARYIRFSPKVAGILRVWEFEAYGSDYSKMTLTLDVKDMRLDAGETREIKLKYDLGGDTREANFGCEVLPSNSGVTVAKVEENQAAKTFTIQLTGGQLIGETDVVIRVTNGEAYLERTINVVVDNPAQPNILSGLTAEVRHYKADYSFEAEYDTFQITDITNGNRTAEGLLAIEDPSTHKDDLWAIFTAPENKQWYLAKVNVHLPGSNKGINDNDRDGFVNKNIHIAVGDDLTRMTRVKSFELLQEADALEFIFPETVPTKYLAIICDLYPYFYPSLAEVEAYEQHSSGISSVTSGAERTVVGIYNIAGQQVKNPAPGLYIIRYSDATSAKVFIR